MRRGGLGKIGAVSRSDCAEILTFLRTRFLAAKLLRDRSFLWVEGGGHPKIFELKVGGIPKVEGGRSFIYR